MVTLKENERIDDLNINGLKLIQDKTKYCFNSDSVLLADFVITRNNDTVCDFGTGSGVIPILLIGKREKIKCVYGIEIQPYFCELARRNAELNNQQDKLTVLECDIKQAYKQLKNIDVNVVVSNPPYMKDCGNKKNISQEIAIARHELLIDLETLITSAGRVLKTGGRFYMVHRSERLQEILYYLKQYKFGAKRIRFVYPKPNICNLVLIEAVKDSYPQTEVMPPLVVMNEDGEYTDEVKLIYGRSVIE